MTINGVTSSNTAQVNSSQQADQSTDKQQVQFDKFSVSKGGTHRLGQNASTDATKDNKFLLHKPWSGSKREHYVLQTQIRHAAAKISANVEIKPLEPQITQKAINPQPLVAEMEELFDQQNELMNQPEKIRAPQFASETASGFGNVGHKFRDREEPQETHQNVEIASQKPDIADPTGVNAIQRNNDPALSDVSIPETREADNNDFSFPIFTEDDWTDPRDSEFPPLIMEYTVESAWDDVDKAQQHAQKKEREHNLAIKNRKF